MAVASAALLLLSVANVASALGAPPLPPYFDYDCIHGKTVDWNAIFNTVKARVDETERHTFDFTARPEQLDLVTGPQLHTSVDECPLGVLYLSVLGFYTGQQEHKENFESMVQNLLRMFPLYAIALARWPTFYALEHFSASQKPQPSNFCDDVKDGLLDWTELRARGNRWASLKRMRVEDDEVGEIEHYLGDRFFHMLRKRANQHQAEDECKFGFIYLIANQVVAAANRDTQHIGPFDNIMSWSMTETPFVRIADCGWPIFTVLTIFQDMNKAVWFFDPDRKYLRSFSDWELRGDELSPLIPSRFPFLSEPWREQVVNNVRRYIQMEPGQYEEAISLDLVGRQTEDGPLRPIVRSLVDVAIGLAASESSPTGPLAPWRLVYLVLLYGEKWSRLLLRLARRFQQLGIRHPLVVVAIGEAAERTCNSLAGSGAADGATRARVFCWAPASPSQAHRFTPINALLHLGIDVIYVDMDTFMLRDPTSRILQAAEDYDAMFASHADADCINIGVFFVRAGPETSVWFSQFIAWYHDHPFEIDQRGLHVFARLPAEKLSIAYPPPDLVHIRAGKLDDVNEIVIGDVGWHGDLPKMLIFHWCHRPLEQKEAELAAAYDAADAVEDYGVPLSVALASAGEATGLGSTSPWFKVVSLRAIFEAYLRDSPPERTPCW